MAVGQHKLLAFEAAVTSTSDPWSIFGLLHHLTRSVDAIRTLSLVHPRLFCGVASSRPLSLELIYTCFEWPYRGRGVGVYVNCPLYRVR